MEQKEVQMLAAEFVLGTLNRAMLLQFKNELSRNPALRLAVKDWERRLGMEGGGALLRPKSSQPVPQAHSTPIRHDTSVRKAIPARETAAATASNPILDTQTQQEVQAALEQISLDSTLASRVRCGQFSQRVSRQSPAAEPAQVFSQKDRPEYAAHPRATEPEREIAPEPSNREKPDINPQERKESQEATAESSRKRKSEAEAENLDAKENRGELESPQSETLSRDEAALKVQSVLKAARDILAKQTRQTAKIRASQNQDAQSENTQTENTQNQDTRSQSPPTQDRATPPAGKTIGGGLTPPLDEPEGEAHKDRSTGEPGETSGQTTGDTSSWLLRAEDGEWTALAPKIYKKQLHRDSHSNRQSYLLRMIPGGRMQPQRRGGIEEVYVVEGRIKIGENTLGPGDFQAFTATSFLPEVTASGDSLILVRGQIAAPMPDPEGTA